MKFPKVPHIHNVELKPGAGGKIARSAGSSATLTGFDGDYAVIRLASGETRKLIQDAWQQLVCFQTLIKKILK